MINPNIWEKIANGEKLDPHERLEFVQFGRRLGETAKLVNNWTAPSGEINGEHLQGSPYMNLAYLLKTTNQTITHDTTTAIEFDQYYKKGCVYWDSASPTKIYPETYGDGIFYAVMGKVEFASNGTGRRGAHIDFYNDSDVKQTGYTLFSQLPTGIAPDIYPFVYITEHRPEDKGTNFKFSVVQTSGGNLNVQAVYLSIFRVHAGVK